MSQALKSLLHVFRLFFPVNKGWTKFYNFVPAFQKLPKGSTQIVQACDSCHAPGFGASMALAFILGVELFDYVVDGGICESLAEVGEKPNGRYGLKMEEGDQTLRMPCLS